MIQNEITYEYSHHYSDTQHKIYSLIKNYENNKHNLLFRKRYIYLWTTWNRKNNISIKIFYLV